MRRPLLIEWPATPLHRKLSRWGRRCRRPGEEEVHRDPPSIRPVSVRLTYFGLLFAFFFNYTFVPVVRRRMSTPARLPARGRASLSALLKIRPPRPQSSLQLQPRLGAPRGSRPRHRLRQAARPGLKRLPQLAPQKRREEPRPLLPPGRVKSPHRPEQRPLRLQAPQVWSGDQ